MTDDYRIWLDWARAVHGITPDPGAEATVLRRVLDYERRVRAAAVELPFGTEPAGFAARLDAAARDSGKDSGR